MKMDMKLQLNDREKDSLINALENYHRVAGQRIDNATSDSTIKEYQIERKRCRKMLKRLGHTQKEVNELQ